MRGREQQAGYDWEEELGKDLGLKVTPGSGNQWFARMDLDDKGVVIQLKATKEDSFPWRDMIAALNECERYIGSPGGPPQDSFAIAAIRTSSLDPGAGDDIICIRAGEFKRLMQAGITLGTQSKAEAKQERARTSELDRRMQEEQ